MSTHKRIYCQEYCRDFDGTAGLHEKVWPLEAWSIVQQVIKGKCKVLSGGVHLRGMGFSISERPLDDFTNSAPLYISPLFDTFKTYKFFKSVK